MFLRTVLFLSLLPAAVLADEPAGAAVPRKSFHQSSVYPYVFQSESYLATTGPAPLMFRPAPADCAHRVAPPLLDAAKGKEKPAPPPPAPAPAPVVETTSTVSPAGAWPPVVQKGEEEAVDFARTPDEVLEFFRNHDGKAGKRIYLFDPIFQPVKPNDLPRSKATYTQKP